MKTLENFPLQFYHSAWHHVVWNTLWIILRQLSWFCPHTAPCANPASSLAGQCEKQRCSQLYASTVLQQLKHQCGISTVSSTDPKHSTISATMKKMNSIPAKVSTSIYRYSYVQNPNFLSLNHCHNLAKKISIPLLQTFPGGHLEGFVLFCKICLIFTSQNTF